MISHARGNRQRPVNLLQEQHPDELVGKRHLREGKDFVGPSDHFRREARSPADDKGKWSCIPIAVVAQHPRKVLRRFHLSLFIQHHAAAADPKARQEARALATRRLVISLPLGPNHDLFDAGEVLDARSVTLDAARVFLIVGFSDPEKAQSQQERGAVERASAKSGVSSGASPQSRSRA